MDIRAESLLNRDDDTLPYGYFNPETEGKLTWICGEDADGKITSVFCADRTEKKCDYLDNIEVARSVRQELVNAGWQKLKPPEVTFTFPDGEKKLSRKQKRFLQKKVNQLKRDVPN